MNTSALRWRVAANRILSFLVADRTRDFYLDGTKGPLTMNVLLTGGYGCIGSWIAKNLLARGDRVELRGFGAFSVRKRDARTGRNPRTGQHVNVAEKSVPFFKTGKEMRDRLNAPGTN